MAPRIRPVWAGARVAGRAFIAVCTPGDNLAVHVAVTEARPGDVLVIDTGDEPARGYWGEVLTTAAEARGIVGLVIDGGVRDVDALRAHAFPVFAALVALRGASKTQPGTVGGRATVGDVDVCTGDWMIGDADGVTVVPAARAGEVRAAAEARAAKEQQLFRELRAGRTTLDLLSLDDSPIERRDR
jgi:4-hydroxy-4-methyl-2-oxoglutarate aldolase